MTLVFGRNQSRESMQIERELLWAAAIGEHKILCTSVHHTWRTLRRYLLIVSWIVSAISILMILPDGGRVAADNRAHTCPIRPHYAGYDSADQRHCPTQSCYWACTHNGQPNSPIWMAAKAIRTAWPL
jgi:hypothetical protein